ncbi:MAG TPA: tetratricopeptide repeat protein [Gemmatirosa sp.]|nr:tetratricopeptide repeat protein [Gemmatirosa sp.]
MPSQAAPDDPPTEAPDDCAHAASAAVGPDLTALQDAASLETAHDVLAARLRAAVARGVDEGERARLRNEIVGLYRQVERAMAAVGLLKDEVRELVAVWKRIPGGESPPAVASDASAPRAGEPPVVRIDHLGASTHVTKGWSRLAAGEGVAAEAELTRALELAPDDPEAGALLGWALLAQDRVDDALLVSQQVLLRHPSYALARVGLGHACLRRGIFGEAIEHLAKAIRDDTDRKATLYATFHLGVVYLKREMYDDAVAFFRRSLALGPNLIEAYHEMGRAQWLAGDRAAALETWRAGARAGKFSAWGGRCEALRAEVEAGGEPAAA